MQNKVKLGKHLSKLLCLLALKPSLVWYFMQVMSGVDPGISVCWSKFQSYKVCGGVLFKSSMELNATDRAGFPIPLDPPLSRVPVG